MESNQTCPKCFASILWLIYLGEKGRRIRELTSVVQKRFKFPENSVELYAEKVNNRGLCAIAQAESLRYKLLGGLAVRRYRLYFLSHWFMFKSFLYLYMSTFVSLHEYICACLCDNLFEFCFEYAMFVVLFISFYSLHMLPVLMNFAMSSIKQMGFLICHFCVRRWLYHPCFSKLFCWWIVSYFHFIACGGDIFYILHNLCFVIITADGLILCLVCVRRWLDWTCFSQLFYYEM